MIFGMDAADEIGIPSYASALSVRADSASAAKEVSERAIERLQTDSPVLGCLFFTSHHVERSREIASMVSRLTGVNQLVSMSAAGVIGGGIEIENAPGISLLLASVPGLRVRPFKLQDLPPIPDRPSADWHREVYASAMHIEQGHACTLMFADPFSVPLVKTLPAMSAASRAAPVVGGLASSASMPGQNVIGLNDQIMTSGGIGLSLSGRLSVDGVVSQGCTPIGPTMVVTKAKGNIILELGGRRAVDTIRNAVRSLPQSKRAMLSKGILLGRVINEYKDRFGQGDFLIRKVESIEQTNGAIISDDFFRVGQTVQIHVRDAESAKADLSMVLDAQKLSPTPDAGLVFTCVRRGSSLFGKPNHDASAICSAFTPTLAGVQKAKSGKHIDVGQSGLPLAGAFANGEIGPVGQQSYLHKMTTSLALFRSDRPV
jgi:small ligand-binding sensory domain FIST